MSEIGINYDSGFTLLELLIVILLVGVISSAGAGWLNPFDSDLSVESDWIYQQISAAIDRAERQGTVVVLDCHSLLKDYLGSSAATNCHVDESQNQQLIVYPDGTTSGNTIILSDGTERIAITVSRFMGTLEFNGSD